MRAGVAQTSGITISVSLPRDDVCKKRRAHTQRINLVGLNRRPEWAMVMAKGACKLSPRLLEQIMTVLWSFVLPTDVRVASIDLACNGAAFCRRVLTGEVDNNLLAGAGKRPSAASRKNFPEVLHANSNSY